MKKHEGTRSRVEWILKMSKKYSVIYADPPWTYQHCSSKSRKIENHYETMTEQEIKDIKVPADTDCVLYLWVTAPKVAEAIDLMKAWGFSYRTCLVWDKKRLGLGYWSRVQHELVFVGVKGNMSPPIPSQRISSIFKIKKGKHSDKPDYFRAMIDQWFPHEEKLEMFYRNHTPLFDKTGWDVWGNEDPNSIELKTSSKKQGEK